MPAFKEKPEVDRCKNQHDSAEDCKHIVTWDDDNNQEKKEHCDDSQKHQHQGCGFFLVHTLDYIGKMDKFVYKSERGLQLILTFICIYNISS